MILFPFSSIGVEDLLIQLYALPDRALSLQAEEIKVDFRRWIKDHFILTENQVNFLEAINDDVSTSYGEQCSFCFSHRLNIELVSPRPIQNQRFAKWIASGNTITVKTDGTGGSSISGTLTFTVSYKNKNLIRVVNKGKAL